MPKSKDKTKGAMKRRKSPTSAEVNTTESYQSKSKPCAKKKKLQKRTSLEGIDKSRQLQDRLNKSRASRSSKVARNKESRLCGNSKPMPSLSELERMYEDSDDNDDPPEIKQSTTPDRYATPETKSDTIIMDDITKLLSPNSLKNIASGVLDMISDATKNYWPPPIIPPKKQNKSGIPFIVGRKDGEQVPWAPITSFCNGSPNYGVESQEEGECQEENVGPHYANISKSVFNEQSEEIAERLKELDRLESLGMKPPTQTTACSSSPDSNKTLPYDLPDSPKSGPRSFSPLPSTSKDKETILKNDQLYNQSLQCESVHSDSSQEDVEILEVPCETIIIDDTVPDIPKPEPMDVDNDPIDLDDDCCIIIESGSSLKPKQISNIPKTIRGEIYGSLDLTQDSNDNEICEIIDDDDVISESRTLLNNEYRINNNLDSIIIVEPNAIDQNASNQETNNVKAKRKEPSQCSSNDRPQAKVTSSTQTVDNRNQIGYVVSNFFRRTSSNSRRSHVMLGQPPPNEQQMPHSHIHGTAREVSRTDLPSPESDTVVNNTIGRVLAWLTSMSCVIADSNTNRDQSKSQTNRVYVQNNTFRSEFNVQNRLEPRPRTSTEVSEILTQALACANQPLEYSPQQQRQESSPQHRRQGSPAQQKQEFSLQEHLLHEEPIGNIPNGLGDCPICMDSLSNNELASTICGHIFCINCIKTALKTNGKKCPNCRKVLKGVGYHKLFL